MSRALLDRWQVHEFAPGLYAERRDLKDGRLDRFIGRLLGRSAQLGSPLRRHDLQRFAARVQVLEEGLLATDDDGLRSRAGAVRTLLAVEGLAEAPVAECFALVREVCSRQLGLRHYPVQLMGGYAMLAGALAEMQTGEGKTLTAVLPAVTVALAGAPVHVITVNPYLAARDAEYLAPVYEFFGLRVGLIVPDQETAERTAAYAADVTYCVNKDLVFDYLRDRITQKRVRAGPRAAARRLAGRTARAGSGAQQRLAAWSLFRDRRRSR
jgi:preprotein translocase subunit SecA